MRISQHQITFGILAVLLIVFGIIQFGNFGGTSNDGVEEQGQPLYGNESRDKTQKQEDYEALAEQYYASKRFDIALSYYRSLKEIDPQNESYQARLLDCETKAKSPANYSITNSSSNGQSPKIGQVVQPIKNLFVAWQQLNFDQYMKQWSPNARQYSRKFKSRTYTDIAKRRRDLFGRLSSVKNVRYEVLDSEILSQDKAIVYFLYSMEFIFKNGPKLVEKDVKEKYMLHFDEQEQRWLISENFDYIY